MAGSYSSRGIIRVLCTAALSIAVSIANAFERTSTALVVTIHRCYDAFTNFMVGGLLKLADKLPKPARVWIVQLPERLIAMRDYVARQARFERPRKFPQWSLIPST